MYTRRMFDTREWSGNEKVDLDEPEGVDALNRDLWLDEALGGKVKRYHKLKRRMLTQIKQWFGMDEATYKELALRQGGKCALCGVIPSGVESVSEYSFLRTDSVSKDRLVCQSCFIAIKVKNRSDK